MDGGEYSFLFQIFGEESSTYFHKEVLKGIRLQASDWRFMDLHPPLFTEYLSGMFFLTISTFLFRLEQKQILLFSKKIHTKFPSENVPNCLLTQEDDVESQQKAQQQGQMQ